MKEARTLSKLLHRNRVQKQYQETPKHATRAHTHSLGSTTSFQRPLKCFWHEVANLRSRLVRERGGLTIYRSVVIIRLIVLPQGPELASRAESDKNWLRVFMGRYTWPCTRPCRRLACRLYLCLDFKTHANLVRVALHGALYL